MLMRTLRPAFLALVLSVAIAAVAMAESQTVQGKGDIEKMSVKNGERAVVVKVHGLAKPCEAHFLNVQIFWGKKKAYRADAGCYGTDWSKSLYYHPNRNGDGQDASPVGCEKFKFAYNNDTGVYRVKVPCIALAPDKIRVKAEGRNYAGSAMPGEAGPTKKLARG